jgi:DNA-binding CsgD family transcriptional regulator
MVGEAGLLEALRNTLDSMAVGVIIVASDARILHANLAATRMLNRRSPIVSLGGWLSALRPGPTKELNEAVAQIHAVEPSIASGGIGVPLFNSDMSTAMAYVLPLPCRDMQAEQEDQANAVVFVTSASRQLRADISAVGRIFQLTPAEMRLLKHLVAGARISDAAAALGITQATAKTHCSRIFSKAGVSRLVELMTMIGQLTPPICRA